MANKSYAEKLKDPRWQKKRLEIMNRDKWRCKLCGDATTQLQVHHKEYIKGNDPWDYPNSMLVTICEHCHAEISFDEYRVIPFDEIEIFKSIGWTHGGMIMFAKVAGDCKMIIHKEVGIPIIAFNLKGEIPNIIKILKKAL